MVLSVRNAAARILRIPMTIIIGNAIVAAIVLQIWTFSTRGSFITTFCLLILEFPNQKGRKTGYETTSKKSIVGFRIMNIVKYWASLQI